jgi:hypothetical protein
VACHEAVQGRISSSSIAPTLMFSVISREFFQEEGQPFEDVKRRKTKNHLLVVARSI